MWTLGTLGTINIWRSNMKFIPDLDFTGYQATDGTRYLRAAHRGVRVYVPRDIFAGSPTQVVAAMRDRGIVYIETKAAEKIIDRASSVYQFEDAALVGRVGWNGSCFALPNGEVIAPAGQEIPKAAYIGATGPVELTGTLEAWQARVAAPLINQTLPAFLMMLQFAAPLFSLISWTGRIGVEVVAPTGTGKTTMRTIMASVGGSLTAMNPNSLDGRAGDTIAGTAEFADLLGILPDLTALTVGGTKATKTGLFKSIVHGEDVGAGSSASTMYYLSSTDGLVDMLDVARDVEAGAAGKLITLRPIVEKGLGLLDNLPKGYSSGAEFVNSIRHGARHNAGHAMRQYLRYLVDARARNDKQLVQRIERFVACFRTQAKVDLNDGAAVALADIFAMAFVGGRLARAAKVLPDDWVCGPVVLRCYCQLLVKCLPARSLIERLQDLAQHPDTIDLRSGSEKPGLKAIQNGKVFLTAVKKRPTLLIRPQHIHTYLPDWVRLARTREVELILDRHDEHVTVKRTLSPGTKTAMLSFALPLD